MKGEFADDGIRVDKQLVPFIVVERATTKLGAKHLRQVELYAATRARVRLADQNADRQAALVVEHRPHRAGTRRCTRAPDWLAGSLLGWLWDVCEDQCRDRSARSNPPSDADPQHREVAKPEDRCSLGCAR